MVCSKIGRLRHVAALKLPFAAVIKISNLAVLMSASTLLPVMR